MLVLSRKAGEGIYIGDIRVTVVDLRPGRVRLGVTAPRDVEVHRDEIYHARQARRGDNAAGAMEA